MNHEDADEEDNIHLTVEDLDSIKVEKVHVKKNSEPLSGSSPYLVEDILREKDILRKLEEGSSSSDASFKKMPLRDDHNYESEDENLISLNEIGHKQTGAYQFKKLEYKDVEYKINKSYCVIGF